MKCGRSVPLVSFCSRHRGGLYRLDLVTPHSLLGVSQLREQHVSASTTLLQPPYSLANYKPRHTSPNPSSNMEDDDQPAPQPLLLIVSHARTNPLRSSPDLKYDARSVPNPPKQIREKFTGLDKRLRDHMLSHGDFVSLVDRAESDIKALIRKMTDGDPKEGILPLREWKPPRPRPAWAVKKEGEEPERELDGDGDDEDGEEEEEDDELDDEERPTLKVGVFCVRGRHRSVAFAEELSQRLWPKEWEVRVVHRDLGRARKGSIGRLKFNRRDSLGRGFLDDEDD